MKLNENQIRQLIAEEIDRQYLEQLDEGVGEYLKTAYNYYAGLAKKAKDQGVGSAVKTYAKDMSDVGATDTLEWVAVIPALGIPAGIAAIGLRIAAEQYLQATLGVLVTAAAQVGGGAAIRAANSSARLAALLSGPQAAAIIRAATQILTRVANTFRRIPRIGPVVVQGVNRIQGEFLKKTAANLGKKVSENDIQKAVKDNQKIMKAYKKVQQLPAAKQVAKSGVAKKGPSADRVGSGEMFPGNRKDNINETIYNILKGDESVKITKNLIRKVVKESLNKTQLITERSRMGREGGVVIKGDTLQKLAAGQEILIPGASSGPYEDVPHRLKLVQGEKTMAAIAKIGRMVIIGKDMIAGSRPGVPNAMKIFLKSRDGEAVYKANAGENATLTISKLDSKGIGLEDGKSQKVEAIKFEVNQGSGKPIPGREV